MERKKDEATRKGRSGGETVRTRRRWRAEEKLTIIKEAKEGSSVAEVCRKHSIDPSMLAKWRELYEVFGLEGLKTHSTAMGSGLGKLKKENERLKKLLAEKDLEVQMLSEAYKKGRGGCHEAGIRLLGFRQKPEKVGIPPWNTQELVLQPVRPIACSERAEALFILTENQRPRHLADNKLRGC